MNVNPFTAVKDKFFSSYIGSDDQKDTENYMSNPSVYSHMETPSPQHHQPQHLHVNGNHNENDNTNHTAYHSSNAYDNNSSKYAAGSSNSYTSSYSKPYHSKNSQNGNSHKIHSRSYQYQKQRRKEHRNRSKSPSPYHSKSKRTDVSKSSMQQRADVIADYLEKVPLLARLTRQDRYNLGKTFKQKIYAANDVVIRQSEPGNEFFIITKGDASVIVATPHSNNSNSNSNNAQLAAPAAIHDETVAVLHPGDYFGETALLTSKPRNATVRANNNPLHCLVLDKETFIATFGRERVRVNFGKRGAISAETVLLQRKTLKQPSRSQLHTAKDVHTKDLIASAIENNVLFAALDDDQIERIVQEMWSLQVAKGDNIINQGEAGDNFYVVEKGTFNIYVARDGVEKLVATRSSGESFGELALMYNSPRSATVKAMTPCKVWAVQRYMFRKILIRVSEEKLREYERFLKQVHLLDSLLVNERRAVAEALNEVVYKKGDKIVEQGEDGDTFYIIKSGEAVVEKVVAPSTAPIKVAKLKAGSFFGERALIKNQTRAATVSVASPQMTCLTLDRDAFSLLLGPLAELMHRKIDEDYDRNQANSNEQAPQHNVIRIEQHHANQAEQHAENAPNQYKGYDTEKYIETKSSEDLLDVTHNEPLDGRLDRRRSRSMVKRIAFDELKTIGILGRGSFGAVDLVVDRKTHKTYALKSVSKQQIVRTGQQEHIVSEKNVMMMLDSPFIVKLYETYKSDKYLYFLLEVILGGELFTVLRARTVFDEQTAMFYTASVVFAFDYMHSKSIIYRDLKPENLLLDSSGYLKITDFGFAKIVPERTYTLCGTPDYLAPEVISGAGHGKGVDWWTLGILLFEMLASYPPFYHEDPMKTYAKIMYGRVNYPKHFSKSSVDIIRSFLHAKPTKRLGIIHGGIRLIQQHKWFEQFDWDSLLNAHMEAPIVPHIQNEHDRSNFETANGAEEEEEEQKLKKQEKADAESYVDDGSGWDEQF